MRDWRRGNDCDDETDFLSQIPHCSPLLLWQQLLCVFCICFLPDEFQISIFFSISCTLHLMVFLLWRVICSLPLWKTTFELITRKMMIHFYFSPYLFNINCVLFVTLITLGTVIRSQVLLVNTLRWSRKLASNDRFELSLLAARLYYVSTHNSRQKLLSKWKHHRLLESRRWLMKLYTSLFFPLYSEGVRYVSVGFLVIASPVARS